MGLLTRILLIGAIALLAFFWIRKMLRSSGDGAAKKPSEPNPPEQMGERPQDLLACEHCGLHLPRADACFKKGRPYCSQEHADADQDVSGKD